MREVLHKISVLCLLIWIVIGSMMSFCGLDFKDSDVAEWYFMIRFWGAPLAVLLAIVTSDRNRRTEENHLLTFLFAGSGFLGTLFLMVILLFGSMCRWSEREVLFTHNEIRSQIVEREYGCGALDSGQPIVDVFVVVDILDYFEVSIKVNVEDLDKSKWIGK